MLGLGLTVGSVAGHYGGWLDGILMRASDIVLAVPPLVLTLAMPQAVAPVVVVAMLDVGTLILVVAGLSFLGLGAQPPTPEWGTMINEGTNLLFTSPHVMLFPGAAVAITVAGFNLAGEALYEAVGVDAVRTPWL